MVVDKPVLERVPLDGGDAGVEGGQLPQGHDLVAHRGARILAGLETHVQ